MEVMESEEVLEARIQPTETIFSKSENTFCFTSIFSTMASIISLQEAKSEKEEENFILGRYIVEVSSPGLDRPLKTVKDFLKVMGREVRFHLLEPIENKIEHSGKIKEVHDDEVVIESKLQTITIPFRIIQKAVQIIL